MATNDLTADSVTRVAAAVIRRQGRVLIGRLADGRHAGQWAFPAAEVGGAGNASGALAEQLRQCLGRRVRIGSRILSAEHGAPRIRVRLEGYACTLDGPPEGSGYFEGFAWALPSELTRYRLAPRHVPIAVELRRPTGY